MTTVRSRATIAKTRRAFEEGKAVFCDASGDLLPAGKVFPSDAPEDKHFLAWPLPSDEPPPPREEDPPQEEPDEEDPPPPEDGAIEVYQGPPEVDDEVDPPAPEDSPPAPEDTPPAPELPPPEPEDKPPRKPRKLRPKKKVPKPAAPKRRFLVINQSLSPIAAAPSPPKPRLAKEPRVIRHFKNPLLLNARYPPSSRVQYKTEYSNHFAWPVSPVRLH